MKKLYAESRCLPILILTIRIFIGLTFFSIYSLSKNYAVYYQMASAAKSGSDNSNWSSGDSASTITCDSIKSGSRDKKSDSATSYLPSAFFYYDCFQ